MCMVWEDEIFFIGIIVGVVGMICIICAYPPYSSITKVRREKLAAEIIRLSNELMK